MYIQRITQNRVNTVKLYPDLKNKDNKIANVDREIVYYKNLCNLQNAWRIQTLTV